MKNDKFSYLKLIIYMHSHKIFSIWKKVVHHYSKRHKHISHSHTQSQFARIKLHECTCISHPRKRRIVPALKGSITTHHTASTPKPTQQMHKPSNVCTRGCIFSSIFSPSSVSAPYRRSRSQILARLIRAHKNASRICYGDREIAGM